MQAPIQVNNAQRLAPYVYVPSLMLRPCHAFIKSSSEHFFRSQAVADMYDFGGALERRKKYCFRAGEIGMHSLCSVIFHDAFISPIKMSNDVGYISYSPETLLIK